MEVKQTINQKNNESPFEMKRQQRYVTVDDPSNPISSRSYRYMANNGDVYSSGETSSISKQHLDKNELDKSNEIERLRYSNHDLNREFKRGQQARKGKPIKTLGGTYTTGTGTSSDYFKSLK